MRLQLLIACVLAAVPAHADPVPDPVSDAQARAAAGDYVGAALKYREAFAATPRAELICNVGVAYYKAKDLPRAQRYLEQCLAIGTSLDATFITNVKAVVAAVEQKLATGDFKPINLVVQPPTATTSIEGGIPYDDPFVGSRRVWFPFGRYRLVVKAPGYSDRVVEIDARDRAPAQHGVALERAPVRTPAPELSGTTKTSTTAAATTDADLRVTAPPPVPPQRSVVAPLIASAATGALGGLALGVYLSARSTAEMADDAMTLEGHRAIADSARGRQYVSWGLAGVAGLSAVAAGVLWYRALRSPARVEVQASGTAASVSLSGRW